MVLQLENRNCSTNRFIFHILGLLALLPCLVLLILLLVDPLEVVEHAPVVGRLAPGLAPGDDLAGRLAPGQVLGPLFLAVKGCLS